jgi:two-component system response regulator PilR (NtrC family)
VWNPEDEDAERDLVLRALDYTRWNRTRAARILGMTFRQLGYRIQKYGLDEPEEGL